MGELCRRVLNAISLCCLALSMVLAAGCSPSENDDNTLQIVAGSEQKAILEEIVQPWCKSKGYNCQWDLLGSVDQARLLQSGSDRYDAYWFASSVFAQLGNKDNKLTSLEPMFVTPIVFAGKRSAMEKLGFAGRDDVGIEEILQAVEQGKTKVWATNPTQSNSGATTLFAFMNHFAGNGPGQPLTMEQLDSQSIEDGVKRFVRAMAKTPPSTGTMMRDCIASTECETVFTYEALVIEENLKHTNPEDFTVVYPQGSLAISDAPLGFLPHGAHKEAKRKIFDELQQHLLQDPNATAKIGALGRRPANAIGLTLDNPDRNVFNPDWGIKTDIQEQGIAYPQAPVIEETLERYHLSYRSPVNTYYCLDGSGSMRDKGWDGVTQAAHEIFDPERAAVNYLQTGPEDRTTVTIFNESRKAGPFQVDGNDPAELKKLERDVVSVNPGGGTQMYRCLAEAIGTLEDDQRKRLIVLMSDGRSEGDSTGAVEAARRVGIPVIAIAFGDADEAQLRAVAEATGGAFVQSDDLVKALREAAGYK